LEGVQAFVAVVDGVGGVGVVGVVGVVAGLGGLGGLGGLCAERVEVFVVDHVAEFAWEIHQAEWHGWRCHDTAVSGVGGSLHGDGCVLLLSIVVLSVMVL
jgi:hypothetical protein